MLDLTSGQSQKAGASTEPSISWRNTLDRWEELSRSINEMFEQLVRDSAHATIDEFIKEIKKRCQGAVDGSKLPYWQLQRWLSRPRHYKVQSLVESSQGPACNRCDRIFSNSVRPTLDHINGDRSNAHPSNLQLLCKGCADDKGKDPPDERDRSPFTYEGEPCLHSLTCVELESLMSDREANEEEIA